MSIFKKITVAFLVTTFALAPIHVSAGPYAGNDVLQGSGGDDTPAPAPAEHSCFWLWWFCL
ncbi:MAG: hypothetical protein AB8B94_12335 [Hyphomicrobiales bacterium]